jgi:hypothetical protein
VAGDLVQRRDGGGQQVAHVQRHVVGRALGAAQHHHQLGGFAALLVLLLEVVVVRVLQASWRVSTWYRGCEHSAGYFGGYAWQCHSLQYKLHEVPEANKRECTYIVGVAGRGHGGAGHQVVSLARLVPLLRELLLGGGVRGVRAQLGLVLVAGAVDGRRQRDELVRLVGGQLHAVKALRVVGGDELRAVVTGPESAGDNSV